MRAAQAFLILCLVISVAGCSSVPQRYQLTAAPLKPAAEAEGATPLEKVHDLVQDSQQSCAAFVNSMFAQTAGSRFTLDVLNTISSALGTVFTPLATVHALTAASTIISGTNTSISAEYLNNVTISHVTQAIQSTYTVDMQKYIRYLSSVTDPNSIDVVAERSTILSYHNECSLSSADGSISSSLQPGQTSQQSQLSVSYQVAPGDSVVKIASGILGLINGDAGFKVAGVIASEQGGSTPNGTLSLKIPAPLTLAVTIAPRATATEKVVINAGPPATLVVSGTAQPGDTITITGTSAPPQTTGGTGTPTVAGSGAAKPLAGIQGTAPAKKSP